MYVVGQTEIDYYVKSCFEFITVVDLMRKQIVLNFAGMCRLSLTQLRKNRKSVN